MKNVLGTRVGFDRLDGLGNAHRQHAALMEGLTQERVVEAQITRHREHGGNGGIVGIDQWTVAELLALGQPCELFTDVFMVAHRRGEDKGETLTLGLTQGERLVEVLFGLDGTGFDRLPECKELLCSVSHQLDEDMPLAATASAKTTHDLCEFLREASGLALERGAPVTALRDNVVDAL